MAKKARSKSQWRHTMTPPFATDAAPFEILKQMKKHGVTQLIHGHTHKPTIESLPLDDKTVHRIVLGSWHPKGEVLIYPKDGQYYLE